MKTNHKLALAVLTSVLVGAAGDRAIHAQQVKTAPAYLISEADTIKDLMAIKEYGGKVPETLVPFDGHYHFIVSGGKPQGLDGAGPPGMLVIAFYTAWQLRTCC